MSALIGAHLGELRHEPTEKRVRAMLGDTVIVDTTSAMLVWEPRRIVPSYAVPEAELSGELVPSPATAESDAPVLHPGIPFRAHSSDGDVLDLRVAEATHEAAAFRPADPDLAGYVILDFNSFDAWLDEDEPVFAHPRDPFKRTDVYESSRNIRIELDGVALAESSRPLLLFETWLPTRFYLPREDLIAEPIPGGKVTRCAYKGEATHFSFEINGKSHPNLAWTYVRPLQGVDPIAGRIAFYNEHVDVVLDGERVPRPITPFS